MRWRKLFSKPSNKGPALSDETAAADMEANHIMISRPGDGFEESGLKQHWGVCVGSHGGHAKTLRVAMKRCLTCCGIGRFWKRDFGKGPFLRDYFKDVAIKHLGGWPYEDLKFKD